MQYILILSHIFTQLYAYYNLILIDSSQAEFWIKWPLLHPNADIEWIVRWVPKMTFFIKKFSKFEIGPPLILHVSIWLPTSFCIHS